MIVFLARWRAYVVGCIALFLGLAGPYNAPIAERAVPQGASAAGPIVNRPPISSPEAAVPRCDLCRGHQSAYKGLRVMCPDVCAQD